MSVLVVGGAGALGRSILNAFRTKGASHAISLDLVKSAAAARSVILDPSTSVAVEAQLAADLVSKELSGNTFDTIVCSAGSWSGGSVGEVGGLESVDAMINANLKPAIVTAHLATRFLAPGGLLVLTGAHAALGPTFGMTGYGMSKVATHHLIKSLATGTGEEYGLPAESTVIGILPNVIDTDANRAAMPSADFSTWTSPKEFADRIARWSEQSTVRPETGSLVSFLTEGGVTTVHTRSISDY